MLISDQQSDAGEMEVERGEPAAGGGARRCERRTGVGRESDGVLIAAPPAGWGTGRARSGGGAVAPVRGVGRVWPGRYAADADAGLRGGGRREAGCSR